MAVVGIALLVLTSGTIILSNYSKSINDQVIASQLGLIGNTMVNNAESMYVLGNESWVTIEFNFPASGISTTINDNRDLVFSYYTSGGTSNVVFFLDKFNISNTTVPCDEACSVDIVPGLNRVKIKSIGDFVMIEKMP